MSIAFVVGNFVESTVALAIGSTDTSFVLASSAGFAAPGSSQQGIIRVDDTGNANWTEDAGPFEVMYFGTNTTGTNTLSGLVRGQDGTTAHAFSAGATVSQTVTKSVLQPLLGLYKASAYLSADQAVGIAPVNNVIVFNTAVYDPNSNFSVSTGLYTAPITGLYQVSWSVETKLNNNPEQWWTGVYVAGSIVKQGTQVTVRGGTTNDAWGSSGSCDVEVTSGQTIGIHINHTTGTNAFNVTGNSQPSTWMTVRYVGP